MIHFDADNVSSCSYHRIVLPAKYLEAKPKVPVFVFNRVPKGGIEEIHRRRAEGFRIVCDVDDYWNLPHNHYLHHHFSERVAPWMIEAMRKSDVVLTTHSHLADRIRHYNSRIVIVPNALPFDTGQFTRSNGRSMPTPFVYVAGPSHAPDIELVREALNSPDVTIAGENSHTEWVKIRRLVPAARFVQERPITSYMQLYDGYEVALAPLGRSHFNVCKSNLKMLEAGAKGLAFIASKIHPYFNEVDQPFVRYARGPGEFRLQMKRLAASPARRQDLGARLAEHVRANYHLDKANEIRRQVFESFR